MRAHQWAAGALLAAGLLLGGATARGEDVFRLSLPAADDTPAMKLGQTGIDADTIQAWRGGGGRGGFHGGFRGGFGGGFRGGYYGGYRGYYGGYRGYYGGYRGYYGGYPGYYGGYYPSYYYYPSYSYYYPSYSYYYPSYGYYGGCYGISGTDENVPVFNLAIAPPSSGAVVAGAALPSGHLQTFNYNGGPQVPLSTPAPTPAVNPAPAAPATLPLEGRPVSLPLKPVKKFNYPAYGEDAVPPARIPADPTLRQVRR